MSPRTAILIPAYEPDGNLRDTVSEIRKLNTEVPICIVNDGSDPARRPFFEEIQNRFENTFVVSHAFNLGKGAAIKTGINQLCVCFPGIHSIVTADADGQHAALDILSVVERAELNPGALVLGVRDFGNRIPLRSRLGNALTRILFGLLVGLALKDTQTGLRAIPRSLFPRLLRLNSRGYEFELDMLLEARNNHVSVMQVPIETIYLENNRSSHFSPVWDSMRIYFVLCRFLLTSMASGILDYSLFITAFTLTGGIGASTAIARSLSSIVNFLAVKRVVFHSSGGVVHEFLAYMTLVIGVGTCSYLIITFLHLKLHVPVLLAKFLSEVLLYFIHFTIQRDLIFRSKRQEYA